MAHVQFELEYHFDAAPSVVWDELVDWKGHEAWIPATEVELHGDVDPTAPGAQFTAWTGVALGTSLGRKLSLEDRMEVQTLAYDDASKRGECLVTKLGPVLTGTASFTVEPAGQGTRMHWVEDVVVPYAPQFLAPVFAVIGKNGFRFGMSQLAKLLRTTVPQI